MRPRPFRVGVWFLYRLGQPEKSQAELHYALVRTLKTASHEIGHLFSIEHCTKYLCVMNGSNSLDELDRHPLDTCPECMAKICWATGSDPRRRFERLADFFARQGMSSARALFARRRDALRGCLESGSAPQAGPPGPAVQLFRGAGLSFCGTDLSFCGTGLSFHGTDLSFRGTDRRIRVVGQFE